MYLYDEGPELGPDEDEDEFEGYDDSPDPPSISEAFEHVYQSSWNALQVVGSSDATSLEPSTEALVWLTALRCQPERIGSVADEALVMDAHFALPAVQPFQRNTGRTKAPRTTEHVTRTRAPFEVVAETVAKEVAHDDIPF